MCHVLNVGQVYLRPYTCGLGLKTFIGDTFIPSELCDRTEPVTFTPQQNHRPVKDLSTPRLPSSHECKDVNRSLTEVTITFLN